MNGVPLVRVEGKKFIEGYPTLGEERFARAEPLLRESRSDLARAAERAFDLGECLYFFAGLAHPDFGDAVLVYEPEWSERVAGGVTPFDTGGFFKGKIKVEGVSSDDEKKAYVRTQFVDIAGWREQLRLAIAEYFESSAAYVRGKPPPKDDPTHRHRDATDRRAWTWEIRIHADHPLLEDLRNAYLAYDYGEQVRALLPTLPPAVRDAWTARFRSGMVKQVDPGESPHTLAQEEMAAACP